ncbi:MAG: hypothetical protein K2H31_04630, partial [Lachnospiraceae bacterium]|nr:hypothetical protein [Lachnospiraceae bacterium]
MKKNIRKVSIILLIILCIGVVWGCGNGLQTQILTESENILSKNEQENNESEDDELEDNDSEDVNKKLFYEKADRQGIDRESAETYFQTLLDDDIFQDGAMELTGLIIEDMDGNGQKDMLVTVLDSEQKPFYGSGCLW